MVTAKGSGKVFIPKLAQKLQHFAEDLSVTVLSTGFAETMEVACARTVFMISWLMEECPTKDENVAAMDFYRDHIANSLSKWIVWGQDFLSRAPRFFY